MILINKTQKFNKAGGRGFFWDSEDIAKEAVQSPTTGIQIVSLDSVVQKLPGGSTLLIHWLVNIQQKK